jgi:hypothetical protein
MKTAGITYRLITLVLQAGLLITLFLAGWFVYTKLPHTIASGNQNATRESTLQIVLQKSSAANAVPLDIPIELFPVDIVAVRHEFFTERPAGKRFDDFLNERMNGRSPISAKLDKEGQTSVVVTQGTWWIHAVLPGDEELEWRLPIKVDEPRQTVELTAQNAYTRTKTF